MERDVFTSLNTDRLGSLKLFSTTVNEPTRFDPNDPHYLYQERKKSRILQRSMSLATIEPSPPPAPAVVLQGDPNDPHTLLRAVFQYYCKFGRTSTQGTSEHTLGIFALLVKLLKGEYVDNVNFAKFCRECPHLLGSTFTMTDVDLTFCKVKLKGERRITYAMFLEAIGIMALKKYAHLALDAAVPKFLQEHIATLPCLQPGSSSPTRSSTVFSKTTSPSRSPPRSPLSASSFHKETASTAVILGKTQLSLEQFERQVQKVDMLSRQEDASPSELQDLEDRIKFCYMLQDEMSNFVMELPRGHEAYRRICKEIELLSTNLDASVKYMARCQLQRTTSRASSPKDESPQVKENAALKKLFPNGPAISVQEAMKKLMQAEQDRIAKDLLKNVSRDTDDSAGEILRPCEWSNPPPPPPPQDTDLSLSR
ncbi:unnamed protein product [Aphanomyces euteiches]